MCIAVPLDFYASMKLSHRGFFRKIFKAHLHTSLSEVCQPVAAASQGAAAIKDLYNDLLRSMNNIVVISQDMDG